MIKFIVALIVLQFASVASAKEYGNYDPKRILIVTKTPSETKHGVDEAYLNQILNDLAAHAKNYPPRFDNSTDQQRATEDVKVLSGMLDILINVPAPNAELVIRAGFLNSIGHNLNIAGSAEKANAIFQRLLASTPSDPRGNYMYGAFLGGVGKPNDALPYLEKALEAGVTDAAYAIGISYLALGDKGRALKSLEQYKTRKPSDGNVDKLIEAIRNGKVEVKRSSN